MGAMIYMRKQASKVKEIVAPIALIEFIDLIEIIARMYAV